MNIYWLRAFAVLSALALAPSAFADDDFDRFNYPFRVYLGGFWPKIDSELAINPPDRNLLPPIDLEEFLGVTDSKGAVWGGIEWHFARRHRLGFEYFSLERSGGVSDTFSPPIEISDIFIESGAINTFYDTTVSRLTYGYSLFHNERTEFQLKVGLHIADLATGVGVSGQICDPTTIPTQPPGCPSAETRSAAESVTAPLPHIGGSFTYIMTPSLALNVQAMGFAVELDSIDGSITEIDADIAWQRWEHFGLGVGFRYFKTSVAGTGSELNGKFDFEYIGPTIYVHATF